jgi:hypothetical protein
MTDDKMTPEEIVARALTWHLDHDYDMLHDYVAVDILNELKYYYLIALVLERDREIAELKTQISFERVQQQAEVNQLNDDIKFLRSKLPNL